MVSCFPGREAKEYPIETILSQADKALYSARKEGRTTWRFFEIKQIQIISNCLDKCKWGKDMKLLSALILKKASSESIAILFRLALFTGIKE